MLDVRKLLAQRPLLFDGGMGTYYKAAPGADCEMANLTDPEGVKKVHAEYLAAGAQCKAHNECKHQSDEFLHFGVPPKFFYDHRADAPGFRICFPVTSEREAR